MYTHMTFEIAKTKVHQYILRPDSPNIFLATHVYCYHHSLSLSLSLSLSPSLCRLQTALHKAAWFGYRDICKILVEKGASTSRTDYQYNTPYDKAVQSGDVELQKFFKRTKSV